MTTLVIESLRVRRPGAPPPSSVADRTPPLSGIDAVVVGLDLSLTRAAACAVPVDWDLDWARVKWLTAGAALPKDATPDQAAERVAGIAEAIVAFASAIHFSGATLYLVVEQYGFNMATRAHALAELGGVVKHELRKARLGVPHPVVASSARKVLLGKNPQGKGAAKAAVMHFLHLAGAECPNDDAGDAFAVANYKLCEWGKGITAAV